MFMDYNAKSANDIMQWYLDGSLEENLGITTSILRFYNLDIPVEFTKDLEWFIGQIERNVFKRIQGQPIILLTKTGYGYDRRESILPENTVRSTTYNKLKMQILSMDIYKSRKNVAKYVRVSNLSNQIKCSNKFIFGFTTIVISQQDPLLLLAPILNPSSL